jgi:hypothetical protein
MAIVDKNFDWCETNRKLVVLALNYGRGELLRRFLEGFHTDVPEDQWLIVIGNDGIHEDYSDWKHQNVRQFTLLRKNLVERNGAFIRNYFIKRCQSDLLLQKDAEVCWPDDCIRSAIKAPTAWRPGWIYVLNQQHTDEYVAHRFPDQALRGTNQAFNMHGFPNKIVDHHVYTPHWAKAHITKAAGGWCCATYYHYSYCVKTKVLQDLRGYDEDFTTYGFEDSNMYCRLAAAGVHIYPYDNIRAVHLFHTKDTGGANLGHMGNLFQEKDPANVVANLGREWGEG